MALYLAELRDPIQIAAIAVIVLVFLLSWIGLWVSTRFFATLSSQAESVLTSLGIFFTFLGIFLGLQEFNTTNIQASIPILLDGLRLAFLSSVFGLGTALVFRTVVRPMLSPKNVTASEVTPADVVRELSNINSSTIAVKDALVGDGDASVATQLVKLRTDFRDFAEKVSQDGADALIRALEEVIADFNAKINEQFGENFKQLNEAVGALLRWQEEYKNQVEFLIESFNEMKTGISEINSSVVTIEQSTARIPTQMEELESITKITDQRMVEIHEGLSSIAQMREQAVEAMPVIEKNLSDFTEGVREAVDQQLQVFNRGIESSEKMHAEQMSKFQGVLDSLNIGADNVLDSTTKVSTEVEKIVQRFNEQQSEYSKSLRNNLEESVSSVEEILNKGFSELDAGMRDELQRCLDMMGQNLTAVTKAFVEQYEPFSNSIAQTMQRLRQENVSDR